MKCKQVKKLLHIYLDGFLEEKKAREIRKHLEKCENCKREVEHLKNVIDLMESYPIQEPSSELSLQIKRRVRQYAENIQNQPSIFKKRWFEWQTAFAILISLILVGTFIYLKGNLLMVYSQKILAFSTQNISYFSSLISGIFVKFGTTLGQFFQNLIKFPEVIQSDLWSKELQILLYIALPFIVLLNLWFYFTSPKLNGESIRNSKQF
ncbi:MAG: anti-sigma factor family protein [Candidatus Aminicenantia bacterium]